MDICVVAMGYTFRSAYELTVPSLVGLCDSSSFDLLIP